MIPEKPKRTTRSRRFWGRAILSAVLVLPLPLLVLIRGRLRGGQFVDVLLLGIMLCCALYLIYQGILWFLALTMDSDSDAES